MDGDGGWMKSEPDCAGMPIRLKMKKAVLSLALFIGLIPEVLCWTDFAYRIHLYCRYGEKPFVNHVAPEHFNLMFALAGVAFALFVIGMTLAVLFKMRRWAVAYGCALIFIAGYVFSLDYIHRNHILVTYDEFIGRHGP